MSTNPPTTFAALLRQYRIDAGLTQEKLAERTQGNSVDTSGLTYGAIQSLESGRRQAPRAATVEMLADALQLTGVNRQHFCREAEKLRVKNRRAPNTPRVAASDASPYLPRMTPNDATAGEVFGPPSDEGMLPIPDCFVGREVELDWLADRLRRGGTTGITAVQGIGGIGKTSLACMAIHALRKEGRFTGGVGVVICQEETDAMQVTREVLSRFDPQRRPPSDTTFTQLHDTARRLLGQKDALVVLDNVEPELAVDKVVGPLQAAGATILLTSRAYLPIGETLDLRLLTPNQAQEMFWFYYGRQPSSNAAPNEESEAVARIVTNLGSHTLAVKVAAHYARKTRRMLSVLADELSTRQDIVVITDAINLVFQHSVEALPQRAQLLFAALGAFATSEFSRNAAKALAKAFGHTEPGACVDSLIERALVEPMELHGLQPGSDMERLRLHPLLQAFAIDLLRKLPEKVDIRARRTLVAYYADYASRPLRVTLGPDAINITAALVYAHEHRLDDRVAKICLGMQAFWRDFGRAEETEKYVPMGIAAAEHVAKATGTPEAYLAYATMRLAYIRYLRLTGMLDEAEDLAQQVLATFRAADNLQGRASTLTVLGNIARDKGHYELARTYLREALTIFRMDQVQDRAGQGIALCFLGQASQRLGEMETAERELEESLATYRGISDQWGVGLALILLGRISIQRGRFQEADARYQEALGIHERLEARRSIGTDLSSLGEIALSLGNLAAAEQYFHQSLKARRDSRDRRGEAVDYTFLGRLAGIQTQWEDATRYLNQALSIWEDVQDPRGKGWLLSEQAQLALSQGELDEADTLLSGSLEIRQQVGDRRGEAVDRRARGEIALCRGDMATADDQLQQAERLAREVEDWPEQARIQRVGGALATAYGNLDRAEVLIRKSLALATKLGIQREMAQAEAALGQLLAGQDQRAEGCQHLTCAATTYTRCGIPLPQDIRHLMVELGCRADA